MSTTNATDNRAPMGTIRAAQYLTDHGFPMSPQTLRRRIHDGEIEAVVTRGGHARISVSELERYMKSLS